MKKFVIVGLFAFLAIGLVVAQVGNGTANVTDDVLVTATVLPHLYIVTPPADVAFTTAQIDAAAAGTAAAVGTSSVQIRSNTTAWTFKAYADKGALTQYTGLSSNPTYVTAEGATTIPYTFNFNNGGISDTLADNLTALTAASVSFTSRTTGTTGGQPFPWTVTIAAVSGGADWDAANYMDVIHFVVTAP